MSTEKPLYVALHVASLLLGFAAAWSIRADQVGRREGQCTDGRADDQGVP